MKMCAHGRDDFDAVVDKIVIMLSCERDIIGKIYKMIDFF